jgi:hypothetical protein
VRGRSRRGSGGLWKRKRNMVEVWSCMMRNKKRWLEKHHPKILQLPFGAFGRKTRVLMFPGNIQLDHFKPI